MHRTNISINLIDFDLIVESAKNLTDDDGLIFIRCPTYHYSSAVTENITKTRLLLFTVMCSRSCFSSEGYNQAINS